MVCIRNVGLIAKSALWRGWGKVAEPALVHRTTILSRDGSPLIKANRGVLGRKAGLITCSPCWGVSYYIAPLVRPVLHYPVSNLDRNVASVNFAVVSILIEYLADDSVPDAVGDQSIRQRIGAVAKRLSLTAKDNALKAAQSATDQKTTLYIQPVRTAPHLRKFYRSGVQNNFYPRRFRFGPH